jgi:hypothetical protein
VVNTYNKHPIHSKKSRNPINYYGQRLLAFNQAARAKIISTVAGGKIMIAKSATGKQPGYCDKELLAKSTSDIFNTIYKGFLEILRQRKIVGHNSALVIAIKKSGHVYLAEITFPVFSGEHHC